MRSKTGGLLVTVGALALGLGLFTAVPGSSVGAQANPNPGVCQPQNQHITPQNGTKSITVTAPEGKLISGYCVKAGSIQQGNGPSYVSFDPPVEQVTITHPSGKDISHYIVFYVDRTTTTSSSTTTTSTTSTTSTTTTTSAPPPPEPGPTVTTVPEEPSTTVEVQPPTIPAPSSPTPTDREQLPPGQVTTAPPSGGLPSTGSDSAPYLLALGSAFLITGGAMIALRRRSA